MYSKIAAVVLLARHQQLLRKRESGELGHLRRRGERMRAPASAARSASALSLCATRDDIEIPRPGRGVQGGPALHLLRRAPRPTCSTADGARAVLKAADRRSPAQAAGRDRAATRHLSRGERRRPAALGRRAQLPAAQESTEPVSKAPEVMATAGWGGRCEQACSRADGRAFPHKRPRDDDGEGALDRVKRMRVSELRQELTKSGLDTDGARAELEARLREQLGRGA